MPGLLNVQGRPLVARQPDAAARFPERSFTDKRARASNARPYKSFLTACGEHGLPASLIRYRPPGKAIHIYCGCVQTLHPYKDMLEQDGEIYPVRPLHYNIAKLPGTAIIQKASQTKKETT